MRWDSRLGTGIGKATTVVMQAPSAQASWHRGVLGDYSTLTKGLSYKSAFLSQDGPQLLGLGQFIPGGGAKLDRGRTYSGEYRDKDVARPGDVLIAMTDLTQRGDVLGSPLMVPQSVGDFCLFTLDAGKLKARNGLDPLFLYYMLRNRDFRRFAAAHATGTTVRRVRPVDVLSYEVRLPPLREQRAIAQVLGTLDNRIELNRRMNETLEAIVRSLFKSWFVNFDPVQFKLEGRDTGLPHAIAELFPDRFVGSELGEIPDGWTIGSLDDIATVKRNGVDPGRVARDTPYIGLQHMPRQSIALMDWGEASSVSSGKFAFKVGDILFGKLRPYFHKVGVAPVEGLCSTDIVVLNERRPNWSAFVLACVSSSTFVAHTSQTSTGTKMPRTSWQAMSTYKLCRPANAVAEAFQDIASPMLGTLLGNIHQSRTLAALREALLPKLISGQIRVPAAERILESAA